MKIHPGGVAFGVSGITIKALPRQALAPSHLRGGEDVSVASRQSEQRAALVGAALRAEDIGGRAGIAHTDCRRKFPDRSLHGVQFALSVDGGLHARLPIELRLHSDTYRLELCLQLGLVVIPRCEPRRVAGVPIGIGFSCGTHRRGRVFDEVQRRNLLQLRPSNAIGLGLRFKCSQLGSCRGHFLTQAVAPDRWVDGDEITVAVDGLIDETTLGTDAGARGHFGKVGRTATEAGSGHITGLNRQGQSHRGGDQRAR